MIYISCYVPPFFRHPPPPPPPPPLHPFLCKRQMRSPASIKIEVHQIFKTAYFEFYCCVCLTVFVISPAHWDIFHDFLSFAELFKIDFFQNFSQEYHQNVTMPMLDRYKGQKRINPFSPQSIKITLFCIKIQYILSKYIYFPDQSATWDQC